MKAECETVVRAVDGRFTHENDECIEKDRFDLVLAPLVDVLDVIAVRQINA